MPIFRVRLEAQDGSGHFRQTSLEAADKAEAKRFCERQELKRVLYEIPADLAASICAEAGVESLDELPRPSALLAPDEDKAEFRALRGNTRARIAAHFQSDPYKVVKVEQVGGGD